MQLEISVQIAYLLRGRKFLLVCKFIIAECLMTDVTNRFYIKVFNDLRRFVKQITTIDSHS